ncbi:MAG: S8 family serine peptidase, partial [Nitrospinales bacterium]
AGIIGAEDNDIGVVGVAPSASLWAVRVLDKNGAGFVSDVISGITWAINNGMQVINMSLGVGINVLAFRDAVDAAHAAGIVLVAAAGNSGGSVLCPACYASVIAVAASDANDNIPVWNSRGPDIELAAPGVAIRSTWNDGKYNTISGTSMASPHVAGTAALMLADDPTLTPHALRLLMQGAADDLPPAGFDNFSGYGLVDAEESVTGVETP